MNLGGRTTDSQVTNKKEVLTSIKERCNFSSKSFTTDEQLRVSHQKAKKALIKYKDIMKTSIEDKEENITPKDHFEAIWFFIKSKSNIDKIKEEIPYEYIIKVNFNNKKQSKYKKVYECLKELEEAYNNASEYLGDTVSSWSWYKIPTEDTLSNPLALREAEESMSQYLNELEKFIDKAKEYRIEFPLSISDIKNITSLLENFSEPLKDKKSFKNLLMYLLKNKKECEALEFLKNTHGEIIDNKNKNFFQISKDTVRKLEDRAKNIIEISQDSSTDYNINENDYENYKNFSYFLKNYRLINIIKKDYWNSRKLWKKTVKKKVKFKKKQACGLFHDIEKHLKIKKDIISNPFFKS